MALNLKQQKEYNKALEESVRHAKALGEAFDKTTYPHPDKATEENLKTLLTISKLLSTEYKEWTKDISGASEAFKKVVNEIKNSKSGVSDTVSIYKKLTNEIDKIEYHQKGINKLSLKELETVEKNVAKQMVKAARTKNIIDSELDALKSKQDGLEKGEELTKKEIKDLTELELAQGEINALLEEKNAHIKQINATLKEEITLAKEFNDALGITGGIAAGLGDVLGKLGLTNLKENLNIEGARDAAKEFAEELKDSGEDITTMGNKFQISSNFVGNLGKNIMSAFSPIDLAVAAIGFIVDAMMDLDKRTGQIAKNFGISYDAASGVSEEMNDIANSSYLTHITTQELTDTFLELNNRYGTFAKMNTDNLIVFQELKDLAGLSMETIGTISDLTLLTGEHAEDITKEILGQAAAYNAINGTALNEKQILEGINDVSSATLLSLDKSPGAIADAVIQAKALGLEMSQIEAIADSLLKFESSITAEMEAELLTGKSLNLEQARYYALTNNVGGLAKELAKNIGTSAEFGKMTRIEQEKLAAAVGMSKDELANTLTYQEELAKQGKSMNKVTEDWTKAIKEGKSIEEARAIVGESSYTNMLASQTAGEKFTDQINKLKEAFIPIAQALMPVVEAFADIFTVIGPIVGFLGQIIKFTVEWGKGLIPIYAIWKGVNLFKKAWAVSEALPSMPKPHMLGGGKEVGDKSGGIIGKVKGFFKGDDKAAEGIGKTSDKTKGIKASQGKEIKEFLKGLGDGLASIGEKFGKVVGGGAALLLSSPGLIALSLAAFGLKTLSNVDSDGVKEALEGLGDGLASIGEKFGKVVGGGVALLLASPGLIALSLAAPGLLLLSMVPGEGLRLALQGLGQGLAAFGKALQGPQFGYLAAGLALLTGAVIGIGFALKLASPAFEAIGTIITSIFSGVATIITAIADGFTQFLGAITLEKAATLPLVGLGLISLAAGVITLAAALPFLPLAALSLWGLSKAIAPLSKSFEKMAGTNIEGIANQLTQLGGIGPELASAGVGLFAIAGGLIAFSSALAGGSIATGLTSFLTGGGVLADLQTLADMAQPLATVGVSLTAIATGLAGIALALSTLETEKINELKGLVMTTAFAAPMVAATGAITDLISGITGGGEAENDGIIKKIEEVNQNILRLIGAVESGGDVYIDGSKAGRSLVLAASKMG
jgi:hypothetical protein